jgi:hypothetical protein
MADKEFNLGTLKDLHESKKCYGNKTRDPVLLFGCNVTHLVKAMFGDTMKHPTFLQTTDRTGSHLSSLVTTRNQERQQV